MRNGDKVIIDKKEIIEKEHFIKLLNADELTRKSKEKN